jgi:glycosyltransferase involved in cell wall biosynthesis
MNIYTLCPDGNHPCGGIRVFYQYTDLLNKNGYSAFILHHKRGFRCTWFENKTKIAYIDNSRVRRFASKIERLLNRGSPSNKLYLLNAPTSKATPEDFFILPAIGGPNLAIIAPGSKKIIFNQGCYYATFKGYTIEAEKCASPYLHEDVIGAIVVSEDSKRYLQYVFPNLYVFRHHNSIDPTLFSYQENKKRQICFITSKNMEDIRQVINILRFRNALDDFQLVPISNKTQREISQIFKQSLIFLSFGSAEGCPMPPAEAMACGCIVIGYHGRGGKEYFKPEFSFPIEAGDIIGFAKTVEEVINIYEKEPHKLLQKTRKASAYIRKNYSPEREQRDVVEFWSSIVEKLQFRHQ